MYFEPTNTLAIGKHNMMFIRKHLFTLSQPSKKIVHLNFFKDSVVAFLTSFSTTNLMLPIILVYKALDMGSV
jgi:hypothetical protein